MTNPIEPIEAFDRIAVLYDKTRPGYPTQLFVDLLDSLSLQRPGRFLEIGSGSGQATLSFATARHEILCLEPARALARLAAEKFRSCPGVRVQCETFEEAVLPLNCFDLVFAAQAFHWIAKDVALTKTAKVLHAGGTLAAFWNTPRSTASELRGAIDAAYGEYAPRMQRMEIRPDPGYRLPDMAAALEQSPQFEAPWSRTYRWSERYTTSRYIDLLQTHSDHQKLPPAQFEGLLRAVSDAVDAHGGTYDVDYETHLFAARRAP